MIKLHNLTKMYDKTTVLQNATYTFPNNGLVCILGESGCGKTTLMNLISGLDTEYTGEIVIDNVSLHSLQEDDLCNYRKDYIGFVFQDYHLLNGYTAIENILYPCVLKSDDTQKDIQQAKKMLEEMGLAEKENEKVQNLSGGQKQRIAIARALIKNPEIILADEPTGALDRRTSTEIMQILKEISKTKLVILITHDHHICEYADEVITINDKKIVPQQNSSQVLNRTSEKKMSLSPPQKTNLLKLASKSFNISFMKYLLVACIFSIGIFSMMFSLSFGNIVDNSIQEFKEKNTAFNNGYIKNDGNDPIYNTLSNDERIENVYKQYKLQNVSLSKENHTETMEEKYPMPKATESMSYGIMPQNKQNEIAITPSLAKKFAPKINELIGKQLILEYGTDRYTLTISGIYNAGYDDFFVSSDIEQKLYQGLENDPYYSITYDVKDFEDIITVSEELAKNSVHSETAVEQVRTMQKTFQKIQTLYIIISGMILMVSMFIVIVILIKLQSTRYRTVGLLYSFGFYKKTVSKIIVYENILLTLLATFITTLLLASSQFISQIYNININLNMSEFIITIITAAMTILLINIIISLKLIRTRPTVALKN